MNLNDFHALIDDFANEGGVQDTRIPTLVRQAALFLERNYNFQYMKAQVTLTFATAEDPVAVSLGRRVKTIISGEVREFETLVGIKQVAFTSDPHAILDDEEFEQKLPVLKFVDANSETWIKPLVPLTEDIDIHVWLVVLTAWPTNNFADFEHPLIDRAEDVLLARSIMNLGSVTKDPELQQFYQAQYQEGLKTLLDSDFAFSIEE